MHPTPSGTPPLKSSEAESKSILGARGAAGGPGVTGAVMRIARDASPDLVELWRAVVGRRYVVIGAALAGAALAAVLAFTATPVYRATATVLIEQSKARIVSIEEVYSGAMGAREHLTTQTEFLKSANVAERVVRRLGLATHPEFDPRQQPVSAVAWIRGRIGALLGATGGGALSDEEIQTLVLREFESRLKVDPIRMSQLVQVAFEATDPKLAARIADAVAEAYIEADMDARYAMTRQANEWLNARLGTLRANLTTSEQALQAYRERKGLVDRESSSQAGASRQFEDVTQRLVEARVRRQLAQQAWTAANSGSPEARESTPAVLASPVWQRAREVRSDAQRRLADVGQRFGPAHPQYLAAQGELKAAEAAARQAVDAAVSGLRKEYDAALALEQSLEQQAAALKARIQGTNRDEFELSSYEREVAVNRQLFETFQARLRETSVAGDLQTAVARVVDPARPPLSAARPQKVAMVLLGGLLGSIVGVAVALLLRRLDATLHTVDEAEAELGVPVLTALPRLSAAESRQSHDLLLRAPRGGFSEAVRTARTALQLATGDRSAQVVVVTSSLPGEGKSTVARNLALAWAQTRRTLLVQADLRLPPADGGIDRDVQRPGLADLLERRASPADCIRRVRDSRLCELRAGTVPSNPLELLSSSRFGRLIDGLRGRFDVIVIDTPPVSLVSDAIVVATRSSGVVFVVRAESTPVALARQSLRRLADGGAPVLGTVLNGLDFERATRYYGEYSAYSAAGYGGHRPLPDAA